MISLEVDQNSLTQAISAIQQYIESLGAGELEVGLLGNPGEHGSLEELWRIAWINELGSAQKRIPPRPFITQARMQFESEFAEDFASLVGLGYSRVAVLHTLGEKYAREWREIIDLWTTPPNAPATIRKKGFDDPLVETGAMRDAVTYVIHIKGEIQHVPRLFPDYSIIRPEPSRD